MSAQNVMQAQQNLIAKKVLNELTESTQEFLSTSNIIRSCRNLQKMLSQELLGSPCIERIDAKYVAGYRYIISC